MSIAKKIHLLLQQKVGDAPSLMYLRSHFNTNNKDKCKNEKDNCAQKVSGLIKRKNETGKNKRKQFRLSDKSHKFTTEQLGKLENKKYSNVQAVAKEMHSLIQNEYGDAPDIKFLHSHFSENNKLKCKNETDNCAQKVTQLLKKIKSPKNKKKIFKWEDKSHTFVTEQLGKLDNKKYSTIPAIAKEIHRLIQEKFGNAPAIKSLQSHFSENNKLKCKYENDNCAKMVAEIIKMN